MGIRHFCQDLNNLKGHFPISISISSDKLQEENGENSENQNRLDLKNQFLI